MEHLIPENRQLGLNYRRVFVMEFRNQYERNQFCSNTMENEQPKNNIKYETDDRNELDRRRFHADSLLDTRREFFSHSDQEKIMNNYLLSAIGTLGIASGFVCMTDKEANKHYFAGRGLEQDKIEPLEKNSKKVVQHYFSENQRGISLPPMEARLIPCEDLSDHFSYPHKTMILIRWTINNECLGLTGLGEKILPGAYNDEDQKFLLDLTYNLLSALIHARAANSIRKLKFELQTKNLELEDAVEQVEKNRADLDRRLFHLKSFYDIFHELSGLKDTNRILETFLLMIIGILGAGQSYILLLDRKEKTTCMTCRGIKNENRKKLPQDQINTMINKCFEFAEVHKLGPMNALRLAGRSFWGNTVRPVEAQIEILFVINDSYLGLIGFGNKITRGNFSEDELELLMTLVHHLMVFLDNAKSFETIQRLNIDLEKRNIELGKTIEHLTASRHKIEVLERAKARVKSAIQGEMEKAARISAKDIILICSVSLLLGLVFNYANPVGVSLIPQNWLRKTPSLIDLQWAKLKHDAGAALFVDARPAEFFRQNHIQGAVNLPPALFDFVYMMNFGNLDTQKEIIVYGRNISRHYDEEVLFKLASRGHENVKLFPGGFTAWKRSGFPLGP